MAPRRPDPIIPRSRSDRPNVITEAASGASATCRLLHRGARLMLVMQRALALLVEGCSPPGLSLQTLGSADGYGKGAARNARGRTRPGASLDWHSNGARASARATPRPANEMP
eukprot:8032813-Pyramimonas_sp.AAC.1